jgi:hypothetical protein
MTIDFNENILTISDASLSSKQVYQLKFWGFVSVGENDFEFSGDEAEKRLKQVIAYFQKEKLKPNFKRQKS